MNNSKKLLLTSVLLFAFSFPARSGSIGAQLSTCSTGVFNDFAPTNEFGSCWNTIGNVAAGLPGVGPTISTSGGTSMTNLQNFIGTASFQFSNFTSDSIGIGSAIQDTFTLAGTRQLSVSFTNSSPAGSIGFAVIEDQSNSYRFVKLFDMPSGGIVPFGLGSPVTLPSLAAGTYELTIGIANATQPCGQIFSTCINAAAPTTGPQITGVNIQDAPEPAAGWLLAGGLVGLALFRRRILRSN